MWPHPLPQLTNMYINGICAATNISVPNILQYLSPGQNLATILQKINQQIHLFVGKLNTGPIHNDSSCFHLN